MAGKAASSPALPTRPALSMAVCFEQYLPWIRKRAMNWHQLPGSAYLPAFVTLILAWVLFGETK
jgi:hypothetical protein